MQYNILTNNNTSWVNCSRFICFICSNSHIIVSDNHKLLHPTYHTWQSETIQDSIKSTKLHITLASFPWHLVINCSADDSDNSAGEPNDCNYQKNMFGSWKQSHKHSNLSNKPLILIAPLGYYDEGHFVEIRETLTKMWETMLESKWWSIYFRGKKFNMV